MFSHQGVDLVANTNFPLNRVEFYVVQRPADDPGGVMAVGVPVVMRALDPESGATPLEGPTFALKRDQAQDLVDRLWTLGFRPSESVGSVGALAQAEDHIKSLKSINDAHLEIITKIFEELAPER